MPSPQPTRSVAIGRYALAVGAPAGTLISPTPGVSDDAKAEVAEALEKKTAGQVFEGAVADAQEATTKVAQAESLLQDVLAGSLLDPADLSERARTTRRHRRARRDRAEPRRPVPAAGARARAT